MLVDPRWLVRAMVLLVLAALVCGYLTLGLLFYLGSWQLALHPTKTANAGTGLASEHVRFGPDRSGQPQIAGEWLPAPPSSPRAAYAVLFLRSGDGQLDAADGTQAAALHNLGLNVLAFDYRGYGSSAERPHASEQTMRADSQAAWSYLTSVRHIAPEHILVFGSGTGVSVAAQLLQLHPNGAGLIAYNADPEVLARVKRDPRSRLLPMGLVFHDDFSLDALRTLTIPKLLYTVGSLNTARTAVYASAANPKLTVEVPTHNAQQENDALARFLDDSLHMAGPAVLTPQMPPEK